MKHAFQIPLAQRIFDFTVRNRKYQEYTGNSSNLEKVEAQSKLANAN